MENNDVPGGEGEGGAGVMGSGQGKRLKYYLNMQCV